MHRFVYVESFLVKEHCKGSERNNLEAIYSIEGHQGRRKLSPKLRMDPSRLPATMSSMGIATTSIIMLYVRKRCLKSCLQQSSDY